MIIDIEIWKLKKEMAAVTDEIEYEGYTVEAGDMCLALLDHMTGLMCEDISDELANFIYVNMDFWRSTAKLVLSVAHADDDSFDISKYFAECGEE